MRSMQAFILWALATAPAAAQDKAERGLEIARAQCARCHIVDEGNRFTGISSTPSFKTLVTALDDWHERFDTFYERNPHPSVVRVEGIAPPRDWMEITPSVRLTAEDLDAITALAEKIAAEHGRTK